MTSLRHIFSIPVLTVVLAMTALAMPLGQASERHDHDRARQALEAGEILPLDTVLDRVAKTYPGEVVEVELERDHGLWEYEIKILRPGGILLKLKVDARDGRLLESKQRSARSDRSNSGERSVDLRRLNGGQP